MTRYQVIKHFRHGNGSEVEVVLMDSANEAAVLAECARQGRPIWNGDLYISYFVRTVNDEEHA